jgi:hypothetical protein
MLDVLLHVEQLLVVTIVLVRKFDFTHQAMALKGLRGRRKGGVGYFHAGGGRDQVAGSLCLSEKCDSI